MASYSGKFIEKLRLSFSLLITSQLALFDQLWFLHILKLKHHFSSNSYFKNHIGTACLITLDFSLHMILHAFLLPSNRLVHGKYVRRSILQKS